MSDYAVGTVVEDCDEDRWVMQQDGAFLFGLSGAHCLPETLEEVLGPLKVVEEPSKVQPFAGMRALADALTKPDLGVLPIAAWRQAATNTPDVISAKMFSADVPSSVVDKAQSSSGDSFPLDAFRVYDESFNILLKKNADYGPSNIADSPGGPLNGILVRMWDKMSRLRHLVESGATPENESLRDTLMDMANYSLIAMIVLDGNWPGMEEGK